MGPRLAWCGMALLALAGAPAGAAESWDTTFGGHTKGQLVWTAFPDNSIFRDLVGSSALDLNGEARLKGTASRGRWDFQADYQFIAVHSDTLEAGRLLPGSPLPVGQVINDDRRWFDLTWTIADSCGGLGFQSELFCTPGLVDEDGNGFADATSPGWAPIVAACRDGDMMRCDFAFLNSELSTESERVGQTCGERVAVNPGGNCVWEFGETAD